MKLRKYRSLKTWDPLVIILLQLRLLAVNITLLSAACEYLLMLIFEPLPESFGRPALRVHAAS